MPRDIKVDFLSTGETRVIIPCPLGPLSLTCCTGVIEMPPLRTVYRSTRGKGYEVVLKIETVDPSRKDPRLGVVGFCSQCGLVLALGEVATKEIFKRAQAWVEEKNQELEAAVTATVRA